MSSHTYFRPIRSATIAQTAPHSSFYEDGYPANHSGVHASPVRGIIILNSPPTFFQLSSNPPNSNSYSGSCEAANFAAQTQYYYQTLHQGRERAKELARELDREQAKKQQQKKKESEREEEKEREKEKEREQAQKQQQQQQQKQRQAEEEWKGFKSKLLSGSVSILDADSTSKSTLTMGISFLYKQREILGSNMQPLSKKFLLDSIVNKATFEQYQEWAPALSGMEEKSRAELELECLRLVENVKRMSTVLQ